MDKLASFFRPENNLLELVYFNNARTIFELLYENRDFVKNLRPKEAEVIDKLCETKSEQAFYKVLFESDIKSPNISVQKHKGLYILI